VASDEAKEFFDLLLQQRAKGYTCENEDGSKRRYDPLASDKMKFDCRLRMAAKLHSEDMAERSYFSHETQGSRRQFWQRAEDQGTTANGEVIAASTSGTPAGTLNQWLTSKTGHCDGIMNPANLRFGVERAEGSKSGRPYWYWTGMSATSLQGGPPQECL